MLKQLTKWVCKYPIIVIVIVIALTVFFYFGFGRITMVSDMKKMLPEDDPAVVTFDEIDEIFGGAKFVMIILNMGEVFTNKALHEIDRLTLDLEDVNEVSSVSSITNIEEVRGVEDGIEVAEIIEEIPSSESELQKLRHRVLSDDDYAGQIVSKNGKIALVLVQMIPNADEERVIRDIKETIGKLGLDNKAYLIGEGIFSQEINRVSSGDMAKLIPLVILVMIVILYLSFRNIRGIVLPLLIVVVTTIWTLGLMGYLGVPFSMISVIMPIILISMGIADGIHILARYREEIALVSEKKKVLIRTMVAVGLSCFITSISTMIGFGSLYTSSLRSIKDFGLVTAIGVGIAFIITVTLLLAILYLLPLDRRVLRGKRKAALKSVLAKWADFIVNKAKFVVISALLLTLLTGAGILLLTSESDVENFFKPDNPVMLAQNIIDENFEGSDIIQVAVKGNIQDPKVLQAMERFENEISKIEILGRPSSIVNILRNTTKALHEGKPEFEILPETEEEVAQYLLLLSMGGSDMLDNFITFDYDQALIQVRKVEATDSEQDKMIEQVEGAIKKHFSSDVDVVLTGMPVLIRTITKLLLIGQLQSLALAILCIFILMVMLSKSLVYGIFCTLPVSLTVILNFGIMG